MNLFGLLTIVVLESVASIFFKTAAFDAERDVEFLVRSKLRSFDEEEVFSFATRDAIKESSFDPEKPTTFLIHGFMEDRSFRHHLALSRAILDSSDQNLIFVDWGKGAKTFVYLDARTRVPEVAQVVANFINSLIESVNLNPSEVTLIGYSLGAHISGLTGKKFVDKKLRKIIGIDPAGPLFDVDDVDSRLSPESASYTECIHTGFTFGIREPICQVDFYINGGSKQPGCVYGFFYNSILCSHGRAMAITIESIENPEAFYGYHCESLEEALAKDCKGKPSAFFNNPKNEVENITGIFHVFTLGSSPYGLGREDDD